MDVTIYTDGSCFGNPGPGGWGAVILFENFEKKIFGGEKKTTNNRMELTATIKAIEYCDIYKKEKKLSLKKINIYTDSIYVKNGITIWINKWEKNDWKTADKKDVKNIDLWKNLKSLEKDKTIEWNWVKGHSYNKMNDLADQLAKKGIPV
jgi:ribonuclease HI